MKSSDSDKRMIRKLSSSPYLLAVADSVLENVDRETLAELLASYLYLRSKGKANVSNVVTYAVSRRFWECASVAASATPAILAGIISDRDFRSVILSSLGSLITGRPTRDGAADEERAHDGHDIDVAAPNQDPEPSQGE